MGIKDHVKLRRQHRMKQLMNTKGIFEDSLSHKPIINEKRSPARNVSLQSDYGSNDPEYVWKQQYKEWDRRLGTGYSEERLFSDDGITSPSMYKKWLIGSTVISILMFAAVWVLFQMEQPWAVKGQAWVSAALHQEIQTERLAMWYEETFQGTPSFIPGFGFNGEEEARKVNAKPNRTLYQPVEGQVVSGFTASQQGVHLLTEHRAPVMALDEGRVIFVGAHDTLGFVIVIQHANELQSIYGYLEPTDLIEVNDWIKGGERFAVVASNDQAVQSRLFFAVKQGSDYIDPSDVIAFD